MLACKKWSDPKVPDDPRIHDRKYCNDPEAVNYNWNFPGDPDNSVCIYPSDLYKGTYSFTDSIYSDKNKFDSVGSLLPPYTLTIIALDKRHFRVVGFCATDSLKFTAERTTYRASADSTIMIQDTIKAYGQFLCRTADTMTGYFTKFASDTSRLIIEFKVASDTGINFHRGTAIRQ